VSVFCRRSEQAGCHRVLIFEEIFEMRKRILTIGMPKHQKLNKKIYI